METGTEVMETPKVEDVSQEELDRIIKYHIWGSVGVGLIPLPAVDMAALTAIQINLVRKIANAYGIPFLRDKVKNILGALVGGVIAPTVGTPLAVSITKAVPLVGPTVGAATMPIVAGAATYAVGKVFIQHFAAGGTFLTFDPEKVKDFFAEMFKEGKEKAKKITSDIRKSGKGKKEEDKEDKKEE